MSNKQNSRIEQICIVSSLIITLIYMFTLYYCFPHNTRALDSIERLVLAFKCMVFPAIMLFLGILVIGMSRYGNKSEDPTQCESSGQAMKVNLRYLSNTHEQLVLFSINVVALAIFLPFQCLTILPIYASLFVLSRIMFWVGYHIHPLYRGVGFGMSLFPAFIGLFYSAYMLVKPLLT